jgi:Flp pilus assembly CpaE family ATPase
LPLVFGLAELLKVKPAEITPSLIESLLTSTDFRVRLLLASNLVHEPVHADDSVKYEAIVSGLSQLASLVVLDIGNFFSDAVTQTIDQCNEILVVSEPQVLSIKQNARLIDVLRSRFSAGGSKPITFISLNRTRSDVTMTISQMEEILRRQVTLGIPPVTELAAYSAQKYLPMSVAQAENIFVQQFSRLAETIKKHREN